MMHPNDATALQIRAADPQESVWLAANAGSGKTKVLTDRVARMLLAGTDPQRILCLTYTKAAAAEMQNRLLDRLGVWTMLDEADLRAQLRDLGEEGAIPAARLAEARRLFAKAIETPGGLKIQTIHSFCSALLRRFPLEAGVTHGFAEMEDRAAQLLRDEILQEIALGDDRAALDALALARSSDEKLPEFLSEICRNRDLFAAGRTRDDLCVAYGLAPGLTLDDLLAQVFQPGDLAMLGWMAVLCARGKPTDVRLGVALAQIGAADLTALEILMDKCLNGQRSANPFSPKIGTIPTKDLREGVAEPEMEAFNALIQRVADARDPLLALRAVDRSWVLYRFARVFLPRYEAAKAARGWLDFDDLIDRAAALLSNPSVAQWVLFRLDGGIDHILVDEAQDTSPGQWRVIERLADEFTAGEGARDTRRTLFVVGDSKQSIYSFQGADLARFEAMKGLFQRKFDAVSRPLNLLEMRHSFRSSHAVLRAVDLTFSGIGAQGLGGTPSHVAFRTDLPGRVDLWPLIGKRRQTDDPHWERPVDLPGEQDESVVLARTIAAELRAMLDAGVQITHPKTGESHAIHEGDVLILVRRRSGTLFPEIIRACKAAGLRVAGADRLRLGAELAVKDIGSVLAFLATPEDDLALAEALRSPLFGLSEQDLFRLAHPRKGYLWQALRESTAHPDVLTTLLDLRDHADFLRPFDLIERLLNRHGGRERLIARLGPEAEDGIDELIAQALAFEKSNVPSLTGFLGWLSTEDVEVKRQLEGAGRAIRVMTVHGAKGLEAPVVILPDTTKRKPPRGGETLRHEAGVAGWRVKSDDAPAVQREIGAREEAAHEAESLRLLYVAMTRAESWLIVAGAGEDGEGADSWYSLCRGGLEKAGTEIVSGHSDALRDLGELHRFAHGTWPDPAPEAGGGAAEDGDLPDWVWRPAAMVARPQGTLSPSALGGAKALAGEAAVLDEDAALRRGRQLHLLLEHLPNWPEAEWPAIAAGLLAEGEDAADQGETETILAHAARVLHSPDMAPYLDPQALSEVEITAEIPKLGGRIHGTIDRLLVGPDRVRVLDYKSNAVVPASVELVPLGLMRQMAAYRAALRQIHPDRAVDCAILWTATAKVMPLPDAALDAALCADPVS